VANVVVSVSSVLMSLNFDSFLRREVLKRKVHIDTKVMFGYSGKVHEDLGLFT